MPSIGREPQELSPSAESASRGAIVLASASPRRRELLAAAGVRFRVVPADIAETPAANEDACAFATRAASDKAAAVSSRAPGAFVLGADTVVIVDGDILGKPRDRAHAHAMLARLRDRTHLVCTGICILDPDRTARARAVVTRVTMRAFGPRELLAYLDAGEWTDKAGGYGVQERAAALVSRIEGSYTNVVGLPLAEVLEDLLALRAIDAGELYGS
jgi:septum formation protein